MSVLGKKRVCFYGSNGSSGSFSPEMEIISGAGGFDHDNKFVLPRYHFGPLAQLDMEVAMYQLANSPKMRETN